ncbi:AMP-binding enzyme [Georgenia deserti]|uniref:AMP-binding protein n=1 Tax=Georgenia deserti TaxID=2093781 RepID=A0ABW4KZN6_9MICO
MQAEPEPSSPSPEAASRTAPTVLPLRGGTAPEDVFRLHAALRRRLVPVLGGEDTAGAGSTVLLPHAPEITGERALAELRARMRGPVPGGTAAALRTSGSTTGAGRHVALTDRSLVAGADATAQRLGGPGRWVLAVPAHHVAGFQLLVRTVVAGTDPVVVDTSEGFDPRALAAAAARVDLPAFLSLVPTQLGRVLRAGERVVAPLRRLTGILVGGAASSPGMLAEARGAGLAVRTTYGMTETGGGCVYDGVPLPRVRVRLGEDDRVEIAGPVLAAGYLDGADPDAFVTSDGLRWHRTRDRGAFVVEGGRERLRVLGRVDDVVNTGGVKVSPAAVERLLGEHPGVAEVAVVGVGDEEWGELVTAVVVPRASERVRLADLRETVRVELGAAHAPRVLVLTEALPLRGPGKVDRRATAHLAATALGRRATAAVSHDPQLPDRAVAHAQPRVTGVEEHPPHPPSGAGAPDPGSAHI